MIAVESGVTETPLGWRMPPRDLLGSRGASSLWYKTIIMTMINLTMMMTTCWWQWWWLIAINRHHGVPPTLIVPSVISCPGISLPTHGCGWLGEHQLRLLKTDSWNFLTLIHTTWPWPWPWWNTELKTAMSGQFRNFKSSKDKIYRR